jgi:adenylosuccinate synthase
MPINIIIGAQWGDEGKGRITDLLSQDTQVVARYSGGDNAGHTVTVAGPAGTSQIFKLHLLPSGLVHPAVVGVLGNGMVINPQRLLAEMAQLAQWGLDVSPERIKISAGAHLITPAHLALDQADEGVRAGRDLDALRRNIEAPLRQLGHFGQQALRVDHPGSAAPWPSIPS